MIKPQKTVIKETLFVAIFTFACSALMNAVFVALRYWNYKVLTGSLLSSVVSVLNFYMMGIVIQSIIENKTLESKDRQQRVKLSFILRMICLAVVVAVGVALPWFNTWTVVIPIFFPRIAMLFRPFFGKEEKGATVGLEKRSADSVMQSVDEEKNENETEKSEIDIA